MILDEKVIIRINSRNFKHYKQCISNIENNKYYEINILDIIPTSHTKVNVKCDICDSVSQKPYREYIHSYNNGNLYCCSPNCAKFKNKLTNLERYGVNNVLQIETIKDRIKATNLEKYGVEYPSQSKEIQEKSKLTSLSNYGVSWASKSIEVQEKMKNTNLIRYGNVNYVASEIGKIKRIENNQQVPDNKKTEFELYTKKVRNKTNRIRKQLFENWNGLDYYDNENILNNLNLNASNKKYPTIDHKISIYYGFINNIDPERIGDLDNLCITKRSINSIKHIRIDLC